jgi:predicted amidohydrolase YtcJ
MVFGVDRILLNGRILTVDGSFSTAEALAIQQGEIIAVGTNEEIQDLASGRTRVDDLGGATVLPGLIDAHNHMLSTSVGLTHVQLYDCRSIPEVLDRVAAAVAKAKPGELNHGSSGNGSPQHLAGARGDYSDAVPAGGPLHARGPLPTPIAARLDSTRTHLTGCRTLARCHPSGRSGRWTCRCS